MPVKIRGNEYETVPERLHEVHGDSGAQANVSIVTEIVGETEEHITMKAEVTIVKEDGRVVVDTGHAREYFDFTTKKAINFAFALENCETSAVGRALANAGYLGQKVASEEDMANIEDKKRARESQLADDKPVKTTSSEPKVPDKASGNGSADDRGQVLEQIGIAKEALGSEGNAVINAAVRLFGGQDGYSSEDLTREGIGRRLKSDDLKLILEDLQQQVAEQERD